MANSADLDQLASSEANWSGSALFAKAGYIRVQQDKGKSSEFGMITFILLLWLIFYYNLYTCTVFCYYNLLCYYMYNLYLYTVFCYYNSLINVTIIYFVTIIYIIYFVTGTTYTL